MKKKILLFLILFTLILIPKINAACEDGYYQVKYNPNGGTISLDPTCTSSTLSSIKPKRSRRRLNEYI